MILQALNNYYERLEEDPQYDVAPFGFSRQKISFCVTLNADGSLHEIADVRESKNGKPVSISLTILGNAKPSGSGINPGFLWDNPAYLLGYKGDDPKPERTRESFEAFRSRHLAAEAEIDDPQFSAVCRFLKQWNPQDAEQHPSLVELGTGFGVFRLAGEGQFVHEREAVRNWWINQLETAGDEETESAQCLITGKQRPIARLHEPKIKGVWGGQSSGAAIVSFNLSAFESYGKSQSLNAPVGEQAAFQYCTALNYLLSENRHRVQIGDTTTVFWTERPTEVETMLPWVFEPTRNAEDDELKSRVHQFLEMISRGKDPGEFGDPTTKFYVLGLSPNAARISVRFFWMSTLGDLIENIRRHFADLELEHFENEPNFPDVWRILRETVRDSKDLPPLLSGAIISAILTGQPYPELLFSSLIRRIQADREVRYLRAAMIKAHLNRNSRMSRNALSKEIAMSLDTQREEPSYHMGRLFAQLEKVQEDAQPNINDTIKDRYFASASATPATVFPRIIKLNQHHLRKLEKGNRTYHEIRIQEIADRLAEFPSHLNLANQGLFAIGYYHQRKDIFTKKSDSND